VTAWGSSQRRYWEVCLLVSLLVCLPSLLAIRSITAFQLPCMLHAMHCCCCSPHWSLLYEPRPGVVVPCTVNGMQVAVWKRQTVTQRLQRVLEHWGRQAGRRGLWEMTAGKPLSPAHHTLGQRSHFFGYGYPPAVKVPTGQGCRVEGTSRHNSSHREQPGGRQRTN
jgi:hypothetical protein